MLENYGYQLPGAENKEAHEQSQILQDATEWQLNPILFKKISNRFCKPKIDLLASRINE